VGEDTTQNSEDPYDLERFVAAQEQGATYDSALSELKSGNKTGHWMWFVFPQIAGLGSSAAARYFAISSLVEARAYLGHAVLGRRLVEACAAVLQVEGRSAEEIFGSLDALKLRSSMTLFSLAAPDMAVFGRVLERYFAGETDTATERRVSSARDLS